MTARPQRRAFRAWRPAASLAVVLVAALCGCAGEASVEIEKATPVGTATPAAASPTHTPPPEASATATRSAAPTASPPDGTPTPSATASATRTEIPTRTATATASPTSTATSTRSATSPTGATSTPTATVTATNTTAAATLTPTATNTTAAATLTPTATNTTAAATLTPTATNTTSSATLTPTRTATSTPSPTGSGGPVCGDFLLEDGEFCSDATLGVVGDPGGAECTADCQPQACTASAVQAPFRIDLSVPPAAMPSSATFFVTYRSSHLQIPGSGLAATVRGRVSVAVASATFFPNDRDYALRLVVSASTPFSTLEVATVRFDTCEDASVSAADLDCFVEGCAGPGGAIDGCSCSVVDPSAPPTPTSTPAAAFTPTNTTPPSPTPTLTIPPTPTRTPTLPASPTPSATQVSATPTPGAATPTPTATATPPEAMAVCGNFLLEHGEKCNDAALGMVGDGDGASCQGDCAAQACTTGTAQIAFTLELNLPPAASANSTTMFLAYRSDALSIPGSGLTVRPRVQSLVSGATFFPNDRDYAMRLVFTSSAVFPSSSLARVTFDVCNGAGPVGEQDLTCFVEGCAGPGAAITGCTCSAVAN